MKSNTLSLPRCADITLRLDGPKGRGVFATAKIKKDTIIDVCPVLVLGLQENKEHIEKTSLYHYTYNWPIHPNGTLPAEGSAGLTAKSSATSTTTQAVVFGLGSMFNHSRLQQNVVWERDLAAKVITYRAARDLAEGEELCISYGSKLTFEDVDEARERAERAAEEVDDGFGGLGDVWLENFA